MQPLSKKEKIKIFKNLFKGREDVFAVRWEKADGSASGYTPVCLNEWKKSVCLKLKRGKCKDCANKKYISLHDFHIEQHLRGLKVFGIYPLFDDNTSFFIAADFDGDRWERDSINFLKVCEKNNFPAYMERSRSGNGGHVWLFFTKKYPAFKSRTIMFSLLKEAKIVDEFDREDSFDRLFPNQDVLSGKGIGNLIALPLQGKAVENGNSVFLDYKKKLCPHDNQWKFLEQIEKIQPEKLDEIYAEISEDIQFNKNGKKLTILLSDQIYLSKSNLPKNVVKFLRDKLNFVNSEYFLKKKIGFSVYNIEKYFRLIQTNEDSIAIPRGFINELCNFLDENQIEYKIQDKRNRSKSIVVNSEIRLFDHQLESVKKLMSSENGVLVAPPGAGKTIIGIELIARVKQPCLILVHKKQIYDQWVERIENFLSIPKREIGQYGAGKKVIGDKVTVAMVQSLNRIPDLHDLQNKFGMIIVDECHHMPAKMFRKVITQFNPYFLYGLTATPERKNNDAKLIFIYLGEILHTISNDYGSNLLQREESSKVTVTEPKIIIRDTGLFVPFKIMTDNFQILSKIIVFDSKRNQQIVDDIKKCVSKNLKCVVLTERKHHVEVLNYYLKREYETIILTGDLTEAQRKIKIKQIAANNFQVLLATGQLIGEGTDFNNLDCLFLAYPFAFSGKLTQYIGRIQRGGNHNKYIYDYRDVKIEYLEKMFKKRLRYYNKFFNLKTK